MTRAELLEQLLIERYGPTGRLERERPIRKRRREELRHALAGYIDHRKRES